MTAWTVWPFFFLYVMLHTFHLNISNSSEYNFKIFTFSSLELIFKCIFTHLCYIFIMFFFFFKCLVKTVELFAIWACLQLLTRAWANSFVVLKDRKPIPSFKDQLHFMFWLNQDVPGCYVTHSSCLCLELLHILPVTTSLIVTKTQTVFFLFFFKCMCPVEVI